MLKKLVATLDGIDEKYHALYEKQEDGTFKLLIEVEGEDVSGLKANSAKIKAEKLVLQTRLEALEKASQTAEEDGLAAKGEYEKLLEIKQTQFDEQLKSANDRADTATQTLKSSLLTATINKLATDLAGDKADLLKPHIRTRLSVDENSNVVISDINGNASTMTIDQLSEEFKKNTLFDTVLKGRQSSGGGAGGGSGSGGNESQTEWEKFYDEKNSAYSPDKQFELSEKDKELHEQLKKKFGIGSSIFNHK